MSTTAVNIILKTKQYNPILDKNNKPNIGNNTQRYYIVERLLQDYDEFIDPKYRNWFAKKFLNITFEQLHRIASECRQEANNPRKLFAYKVSQIGV